MLDRRANVSLTIMQRLYEFRGKWRDKIARDQSLTPAAFKVGYFMADHVTMEGTASTYTRNGRIVIWPSQARLQEQANLSPDTVRRCVAQLIDRRYLEKLRRGNQNSGANEYEMFLPRQRR